MAHLSNCRGRRLPCVIRYHTSSARLAQTSCATAAGRRPPRPEQKAISARPSQISGRKSPVLARLVQVSPRPRPIIAAAACSMKRPHPKRGLALSGKRHHQRPQPTPADAVGGANRRAAVGGRWLASLPPRATAFGAVPAPLLAAWRGCDAYRVDMSDLKRIRKVRARAAATTSGGLPPATAPATPPPRRVGAPPLIPAPPPPPPPPARAFRSSPSARKTQRPRAWM